MFTNAYQLQQLARETTQAQVAAQVGNVGDFVDRMLTKMGGPTAGGTGATQ